MMRELYGYVAGDPEHLVPPGLHKGPQDWGTWPSVQSQQ